MFLVDSESMVRQRENMVRQLRGFEKNQMGGE